MYISDFGIDILSLISALPLTRVLPDKIFTPPHKSLTPNYCYLKQDIKVLRLKKMIKIVNNKLSQFFQGKLETVCFCQSYPYAKNQHHSSIQSKHIADLILRINLEGPGVSDHTRINGLNQIDLFVYAKNHLISNFILISFIPRFILICCFESIWERLATLT